MIEEYLKVKNAIINELDSNEFDRFIKFLLPIHEEFINTNKVIAKVDGVFLMKCEFRPELNVVVFGDYIWEGELYDAWILCNPTIVKAGDVNEAWEIIKEAITQFYVIKTLEN